MICIKDHSIIFYFSNYYRYILPGTITHHQLHSLFNFHIPWKAILWKFDQHVFTPWSVSLVNGDIDRLLFTNLHSTYTVIKTLDHGPTAYFKLKRLASCGAVEGFAVCECAMIMHFYFIALFCFLHDYLFNT